MRSEALDRAYVDQGLTFSLSREERPVPIDIVPWVISGAESSRLQRGIVQRVQALEMTTTTSHRSRGVYSGGAASALDVSVDMTRLA